MQRLLKVIISCAACIAFISVSYASSFASISSKTYQSNNKQPPYSIKATYPQLTSNSKAAQAFNSYVKKWADKQIADFRKGAQHPVRNFRSALDISFKVTAYQPNKLISIKYAVYSYYAGAAHPNTVYPTLNFNLKTAKPLSLSDLFKSNSRYLQKIAKYCIYKLRHPKRLGKYNFITEGASAKAKNYQNWNVTKKGLLITFNPYQVAAYVYGPQQVLVPKAKLKALLKPQYKNIF